MKAAGRGAWWNQYAPLDGQALIDRIQQARLDFMIIKAGYVDIEQTVGQAGIRWGTERYAYPSQPDLEAQYLCDAVRRGAEFIVINAEIEWQNRSDAAVAPMKRLIAQIREQVGDIELYASVDARGGRTDMAYQRVLAAAITGWMPMIYPEEFYPDSFAAELHVPQAFADSFDAGQRFDGLPVLPTIQTSRGIGAEAIVLEIAECERRGLRGYQAYTIGHATDDEWLAFSEEGDNMTFIGVACDRATLGTGQFESFRLYVTAAGLVREKIPNQGEREALAAAGFKLMELTKKQLDKYAER